MDLRVMTREESLRCSVVFGKGADGIESAANQMKKRFLMSSLHEKDKFEAFISEIVSKNS